MPVKGRMIRRLRERGGIPMRYDRWTGGDYDAEAVERLRAAG